MKRLLVGLILVVLSNLQCKATTFTVSVNDGGWGSAATVNTLAWAIAQFNSAGAGNHIINITISNNSLNDPSKWNLSNSAANLTIAGNNSVIDGPGYGIWGVNVNRLTITDWKITAGFSTSYTVMAGAGGHVISNSSINNIAFDFTSSNNVISNSTIAGPGGTFTTRLRSNSGNTISGCYFSAMSVLLSASNSNSILNSRFTTSSLSLTTGSNNNSIYGNRFNINATGLGLVASSLAFDISINASTGNTIGGLLTGQRNTFALSSTNTLIVTAGSDNTKVVGNYFGTDINGTAKLAGAGTNSTIMIGASQNVLLSNNVVSSQQGTTGGAIEIASGNCQGLLISNNYIGLNKNGQGLPSGNASGFGNGTSGIYASAGTLSNSTITGNVIAANAQYGIYITTGNSDLLINSNIIGLDASGVYSSANDLGNGFSGITFTGAITNVQINNNIICRNGFLNGSCSAQQQTCGVIFQSAAVNSATISGNSFGVDANVSAAGNQFAGLYFFQNGNMGGSDLTKILVTGNTMGDNGNCSSINSHGFAAYSSNYFTFTNNYVGIGPGGQLVGNYANGMEINTASNFLITNNQIANNKGRRTSAQAEACAGIAMYTATIGTVTGNNIFNHANSSGFVTNNGVFVQKGGSIIIGGNGALSNNIYSNGTHGIVVFEGADFVQMYTNSIYCNGSKGINIGCSGGFAGKVAGNGSFGCGTITLNAVTVNPSIVSGGRPASSLVYVYGTNLCQSTTCGANPQGQLLFTASNSTYPTGTTWTYNNGSPMFGDITALALGTGANCSSSYCRTSEYSNCVDNVVLPVLLQYFTVKLNGNQLVELNWKTTSEKNNDYFQIEKSIDGSLFAPIGKVKGAGNSTSGNEYSYMDTEFTSQIAYYRLKEVDFDGTVRYSEIRLVQNKNQNSLTIYPNPNAGQFTVFIPVEGKYEVSILDMLGRIVYQESNQIEFGEGRNIQSGLSKGTYIVQVTNENESKSERVVIE